MSTVWVVDCGAYNNNGICGIFLTKEEAERQLEAAGFVRDPRGRVDASCWIRPSTLEDRAAGRYVSGDDAHFITEYEVGSLSEKALDAPVETE